MLQLAHATIVVSSSSKDRESYLNAHIASEDEIIRVDEHPNQAKTSSGIYIEDVRILQETVRTAKHGVRTIVVLDDAASLTIQAQNALLKLLEEPRTNLHFILNTSAPMKLLETVRSRCQTVTLKPDAIAIDLPREAKARIMFMAGDSSSEQQKLADNTAYFEHRSKLFALAKEFIGGDPYIRLTVVKQVGGSRESALEFIEVALHMYTALIIRGFSTRLRDEAVSLLEIDSAIRANANSKLQLLRAVV